MKIGRNDPCPCGSGKKYKYCCLNKPKDVPADYSTVVNLEAALNIPMPEAAFNAFREERHVVTIEDQLNDLYSKGPFKAESAATVNKDIRPDRFRRTPVIMMAQGILEYLARKGGKIDISRDSEVHLDLDVLVDILYEWIDPDFFIGPEDRSTLVMWYKFVNILLLEKKFIRYSGKTILEVTDKGLKLLKGTGIKTVYFSFMLFLTEKLNWFYSSGLNDEVGYLQDLSGISLFTMNYYKEIKEYFKPLEILGEVDKVFPIFGELRKIKIGKKRAADIFTEYFLEGYCRLAGFVEWVPNKGYKVTELFCDIFDWKIAVAYD